jgi:hypothetical protein
MARASPSPHCNGVLIALTGFSSRNLKFLDQVADKAAKDVFDDHLSR